MTREVVLILGGTKEAAEYAAKLVREKPGARIISSMAGRTKEPKGVEGETRIGGFGGADGLAAYLRENEVTQLIDLTHPFAKQISANAKCAAIQTGVPLEVKTRIPWAKQPGDTWVEVADLPAAREAIPTGARVLLALGSQHIDLFKTRDDVHFIVRMVDKPEERLSLPDHTLLLGKPGDEASERDVLTRHKITHIVCRNSGGKGAYAKIVAARSLGLPVIIVQRA